MTKYTGRQIAIFGDIHGLLYPTIAILDDIKKRSITEIYSLGDNIGNGPNPSQVLDLLSDNGVKLINGNNEEYSVIGIAPFESYFNNKKTLNQEWTSSQLRKEQLESLKMNKHSYDLIVGGKRIGLCHFANDVRIDFGSNNTWSYQKSINSGFPNPNAQFLYTNSKHQINQINIFAARNLPCDKGFVSAKDDPLFGGKTVDCYDEIIQGHVHFKMLSQDNITKIRTIRAAALAYGDDPVDMASYIIIKEKDVGYDVEEILVPYNRDLMLKSIDESTLPDKTSINKYISRR